MMGCFLEQPLLFPIFVIATLAELYVLMTIGSSIGAGNMILLVIITAFISSYLLKHQGLFILKKGQIAANPKCRALIYCRVFQTCSKDETQVLECIYGRFVCF
jgi:hypothetical protein